MNARLFSLAAPEGIGAPALAFAGALATQDLSEGATRDTGSLNCQSAAQ